MKDNKRGERGGGSKGGCNSRIDNRKETGINKSFSLMSEMKFKGRGRSLLRCSREFLSQENLTMVRKSPSPLPLIITVRFEERESEE